MAIAASVFVLPSSEATEPAWPNQWNSAAVPAARRYFNIMYPGIGLHSIGWTTGPHDDFCTVNPSNPRSYHNNGCDTGSVPNKAHRGNDIYPDGQFAQPAVGTMPIVASNSGAVRAACTGKIITTDPSGTREFRYLHSQSTEALALNSWVNAGQRLGRIGYRTADCSGTGNVGYHLHFELVDLTTPGEDGGMRFDPYMSLRGSYSRPGVFADGTVDQPISQAWFYHSNFNGGYPASLPLVGLPRGTAMGPAQSYAIRSPDPAYVGSSIGTVGVIQYLSTGDGGTWDPYRGSDRGTTWTGGRRGVLSHRIVDSNAYFVHSQFFQLYAQLGEHLSSFGLPLSNEVRYLTTGSKQQFERGCFYRLSSSGSIFTKTGTCP